MWFLNSRKVQIALASIISVIALHFGLNVSDDTLYSIVGIGASLILGIAHEDNGAKANASILELSKEDKQ